MKSNIGINLTAFSVRLTKARPERLRLTIYVAPGRAQDLRDRLVNMEIPGWVHSDSTVRVEDPIGLVEFYERTQIMPSAVPLLREYGHLRSFLQIGRKRPPDIVEQLVQNVDSILAIQGD